MRLATEVYEKAIVKKDIKNKLIIRIRQERRLEVNTFTKIIGHTAPGTKVVIASSLVVLNRARILRIADRIENSIVLKILKIFLENEASLDRFENLVVPRKTEHIIKLQKEGAVLDENGSITLLGLFDNGTTMFIQMKSKVARKN